MITVFKLGNIEHKIVPSREVATKLKDALAKRPKHIVWGPDIEFEYIAENAEELDAIRRYNKSING